MSQLLSLRTRRVLVDTSAYFALADDNDRHHDEAIAVLPFAFTFDQHFSQYGFTVLTPI